MFHGMNRRPGAALTLMVIGLSACAAHARAPVDDEVAFRELYRELIEINTTLSVGSCTVAAEAMARRLRSAGLPADRMQILAPADHPDSGSLVALLPGRDPALKPILLLAHIDVVEARREDWERDPFKLVEEDGFFYARGASDDKAMAAIFTDMLVRYQLEGFKPLRGLKLALTCGEETPEHFNSVEWLLRTRPEVLQASFALNEGAGGLLDAATGKPILLELQAGEKVYQDFTLEVTHPGGHSSRPVRPNAIDRLAAGLVRLADHEFPIEVNPTTRAYFEMQAKLSPPDVAADMRAVLAERPDAEAAKRLWNRNPAWNGMLRTTCVATMIEGGHAPNALPQRVRANVNCRILPSDGVDAVQRELEQVLADDAITVRPIGEAGQSAPVPPLTSAILEPVRAIAAEIWPGLPVVPTMSTGGTDGRFLNAAGIPTYGMSGILHDASGSRAHGLNERVRVKSLMDGRRFLYEVTRIYAQQPD